MILWKITFQLSPDLTVVLFYTEMGERPGFHTEMGASAEWRIGPVFRRRAQLAPPENLDFSAVH